jgi:hypothetical protein
MPLDLLPALSFALPLAIAMVIGGTISSCFGSKKLPTLPSSDYWRLSWQLLV